MRETVFLFALGIMATTVVMVARTIAAAISRRGSPGELGQLREQVEQHAAALEDAEATLAQQASQLAELQERLDFTERLLAQGKDRSALGPGEHRP
jgi:hypothetical protein